MNTEKTEANYDVEDIVTIAEALKRLGKDAPTRDALHKAINRGKLKKLPCRADDRNVRLGWGSIVDYVAQGGFKKHDSKRASTFGTATPPALDDEASSVGDSLITSCMTDAASIALNPKLMTNDLSHPASPPPSTHPPNPPEQSSAPAHSEGVVDSNSAPVGSKATKSAPKAHRKPKSPAASDEESGTQVPDESLVNELVAKVALIHGKSETTEKNLLHQRIEMGGTLIELKNLVGHGNFIPKFKKWQDEEKIHFCLKTGERAMKYAELEKEGKFESVSNLADAERFYKAELNRKKQEKKAKADAEKKAVEPDTGKTPLLTLKVSQIQRMAREYAKPAFEKCDECDLPSSRTLLEEIIEVLTEKLQQITKEA